MSAVLCLLESFLSTRTCQATHATRAAQLVQLHYDHRGDLLGAELHLALPDTCRLLKEGRRPGEPTFPIFYQVHAALGKSCLFLPPRELSSNSLFTPLQVEGELETALDDWTKVCVAMEVLGFHQEEEEAFWLILAAITNLGVVVRQMEDTESDHCDPAVVEKISDILGVKRETFEAVMRRPATPRFNTPTSSAEQSTATTRASSPGQDSVGGGGGGPLVLENVKRLVQNLYSDLLARLVMLINRSIQAPFRAKHAFSILLLDSPGLQNPNLHKHSASLLDFTYNYLQERLQQFFFNSLLESLGEKEKGLVKLFVARRSDTMLSLMDRTSQTVGLRGGRKGVRFQKQQSPPGLLSLLHRAASCPWSDDTTFLHRLLNTWAHQGQSPHHFYFFYGQIKGFELQV